MGAISETLRELGDLLRQARLAAGLTQEQVAEKVSALAADPAIAPLPALRYARRTQAVVGARVLLCMWAAMLRRSRHPEHTLQARRGYHARNPGDRAVEITR